MLYPRVRQAPARRSAYASAVNVVVTGAAGFVASHVVDACLKRGDRVAGIDNFITGDSDNLAQARENPAFRFFELDVCALDDAARAHIEGEAGKPERIYHMASPASPVDYAKRPLETLRVNSRGTEACCEAALGWGARILFASTSECYGDPLVHPQTEDYWGNVNPNGPRSCYDEAKRYGEALIFAYARTRGLDMRVVRIFNTYGPRMRLDDGRVVPNFVAQALRGEPLTVYGGGKQTRSFCYVDDLVDGILACMESEATRDMVVNLGNPKERTIREFAQVVCETAGVPLRVDDERPLPPDDPNRRCPDITRARELLGWSPQVDIRTGLRATIEDFARRLT